MPFFRVSRPTRRECGVHSRAPAAVDSARTAPRIAVHITLRRRKRRRSPPGVFVTSRDQVTRRAACVASSAEATAPLFLRVMSRRAALDAPRMRRSRSDTYRSSAVADEPPSDERRRRRLRLPRLSSPLRRRNTPTGLASARRVRSDRSTDAPDESWSSSLGVADASWHASTPSEPISQRRVVRAPSSPASYTMMGSSPPASPPSASPPASPSASPHASRRAFGRRRVARQAQEPVSAGAAHGP